MLHQTKTMNLFVSDGAKRQKKYREKKQRDGMKQRTLWVKEVDWDAGFNAGSTGEAMSVPDGRDKLSWLVGWVEGNEKRE